MDDITEIERITEYTNGSMLSRFILRKKSPQNNPVSYFLMRDNNTTLARKGSDATVNLGELSQGEKSC